MKNHKQQNHGFTLIELLVVISIIGVLSTIAMTSLNGARAKARDAVRLSDMEQIRNALEIYKSMYGHYPYNSDTVDDGCGGWDVGYNGGSKSGDTFIQPLVDAGLMNKVPGDSKGTNCNDAYRYHNYGPYVVFGVEDMEASGWPHPKSPGFNPDGPSGRNWQNEFEWVMGLFEN